MSVFKKLKHKEKYEIVLEMLKVLKEGNENFAYVYDNIKTMGKPTDQLFETIYREVLKLAEQKKKDIHRLEMMSFEKIKQNINSIKQKEEREKKTENPEQLLQSM